MEEYEEFGKRHLARIQTEMVENETLQSIWQTGISVIRFHGIAVLSPLMNTERKLEMQQYRQKAVELELSRQKARKSALLTRVQEIIENVQVWKVPSTTECVKDPVVQPPEKIDTTIQHTDHSSVFPSYSDKPEDSILSTKTLLKLKEKITIGDSEKCICSPQISELPKATCSIQSNNTLSVCVSPKKEESKTDALPPVKESPDHYAMSLQNLLKKSREYVEREQNRRNGKNASKEGINESHSDKENEGVKINDWERERNRISNKSRSSSPVIVDKSSSARSSSQSQVASMISESFELDDKTAVSTSTSGLCSSSNVDFPAKTINGLSRESDSDEEWINNSAYKHESSLLKSLTGSYAKLPNPEPSRSPKMYQRRSRTSTNIIINNPMNAYELSPKEKFKGLPGTDQGKKIINSLDVRRAVPNEALTAVNQEETETIPGKLQDLPTCLGRVNDVPTIGNSQYMHAEPSGKSEINMIGVIVANGAQVPVRSLIHKDSYNLERTSPLLVNKQEIIQLLESQNELYLSGQKTSNLIEKAKQGSPVELNKSYDVKNPSPVLLQTQNTRQQMDLSVMSSENEKNLQSSMEPKAKHEELITKQMMAFEEMRKQLEEQHTLQLSMLIAEQEKEQEKLRREIEEQERRFREQRNFVMESSESRSSKETSLDWRRIKENYPMPSLINRVDGNQPSISCNIAFTNNSAMQNSILTMPSAESSFSRWGAGDDEIDEAQSCCFLSRPRSRWSQINTPEIQQKFNKITALAKGFLTRRLMLTEKLKQLQQTVKDTLEFISSFRTEAPLKRGAVSPQDVSLQERVVAQLRAALYEIHDIFFVLKPGDRMQILCHDREIRKEKQLRQMEKWKSPKERGPLSVATQKSLDRKRQIKVAEMGITSKQKSHAKQKASSEARILQPSQGQNAPAQRLLHRQGVQTSRKGVEQNRERYTESRFPRKAVPGVCPGRVLKTKSSVTTL